MSEEWGPWIKHNGKGCPCVGQTVQLECVINIIGETMISGETIAKGGRSWTWSIHRLPASSIQRIIRYRIRKPRGMSILESLLENLPDEVPA